VHQLIMIKAQCLECLEICQVIAKPVYSKIDAMNNQTRFTTHIFFAKTTARCGVILVIRSPATRERMDETSFGRVHSFGDRKPMVCAWFVVASLGRG
jgi:hypothetical protein